MWISPEFKVYIVKEFQRLKEEEQKQLGWSAKRELSKINYRIHTDAIKHNLIPAEITKAQANIIYANEADVLNVAMFGMTAKQWRDANSDLKGNIRDYASPIWRISMRCSILCALPLRLQTPPEVGVESAVSALFFSRFFGGLIILERYFS